MGRSTTTVPGAGAAGIDEERLTGDAAERPCSARHPILVVEDDLDILDMARELLEQRGHRVETAVNGADALARLAAMERPCVVVLDLFMPVMNGMEFLRRLRGDADPLLAAVPVVIVSAAMGKEAETASAMAQAFLRKPVPVELFLQTVDRYCTSSC